MSVVKAVSIDYAHEEIHEGKHYIFSRTKTMDTVTANTVVITTPASSAGFIHMVAAAELTAAGSWTFSEAPETSAGSTLTSYNSKRNSTNTSGATYAGGVVWTSAGTVLETHYIGANNPASKLGGGAEIRAEYILKPSTKYGIRIANTAATCYSVINVALYVEG